MNPLDDADRRLLDLLCADGRATYSELAAQVGLSIAATKRRVDRLRSDGIITGFTAQIDRTKLGWAVEAFTEMRLVGTTLPADMIRLAAQLPEVEAVYSVAGDPDMVFKLRARDHLHLQEVLVQLRRRGKPVATKTMIVLGVWQRGD